MLKILLLCFLYPFAILATLVFYIFEKAEKILEFFWKFSGFSIFVKRI